MLSGTFDLFPVAEVLGLLERAASSGALIVRGREVDGTLFFVSGEMCGGEVADLSGPVPDAAALEIRLLEVCVSLLRSRSAEFEFRADVAPPWPAPLALAVGPVLDRAREIARDWHAIITAVESFDSMLERTGALTTDSITLSHVGFQVLELIDGRSTIRELANLAGASLIVVGPEVRTLVLSGAVRVVVGPERALATARAEVESVGRPAADGVLDVTEAGATPLDPGESVATPALEPAPVGAQGAVAPSALDAEDLARERADLAARAGLDGPGPTPESTPPVDPDAPKPERAQIVVDRSELLRMFSGLKED